MHVRKGGCFTKLFFPPITLWRVSCHHNPHIYTRYIPIGIYGLICKGNIDYTIHIGIPNYINKKPIFCALKTTEQSVSTYIGVKIPKDFSESFIDIHRWCIGYIYLYTYTESWYVCGMCKCDFILYCEVEVGFLILHIRRVVTGVLLFLLPVVDYRSHIIVIEFKPLNVLLFRIYVGERRIASSSVVDIYTQFYTQL